MGYQPITDLYTIVDTSVKERVEKTNFKNVTNESKTDITRKLTQADKFQGFCGKRIQEFQEEPLKEENRKQVKRNMVKDNMKMSILNT